jgi:hypothetical protein
MNIELDPIDLKIIELLKQDSRLSHKEIGQRVHRTGQGWRSYCTVNGCRLYQKLHHRDKI